MRVVSYIPSPMNISERFESIYQAKWNPNYLCIQDAVHLGVKMWRRLKNHTLKIGSGIASLGHLISLVKNNTNSKSETGLCLSVLMDTKDAMNFDIVQKVTSERVIECLNGRHELGTKLYLQLISRVIEAYIDEETLPLDRMYSAFYSLWFFRLWKE
jgi:hydroxymethylglutaryl-CoA reductase